MKIYPYDAPIMSTDARIATQMNIDYARAKIPKDLPRAERIAVEENIKQLLKDKNAVLLEILAYCLSMETKLLQLLGVVQ